MKLASQSLLKKIGKLCLLAGPVAAITSSAMGQNVILNDGLPNIVNTVSNPIEVRNGPGNAPTTLIIEAGADIATSVTPYPIPPDEEGSVYLYENSILNMSGGLLQDELWILENSVATITGGTVTDDITTAGNAVAEVSAVMVLDDVESQENSTLNLHSGNYDEDIEATGTSQINIYNGDYQTGLDDGGNIVATDDSTIKIFGGTFGIAAQSSLAEGGIQAEGNGIVHVYGGTFQPQDEIEFGALFQANDTGTINIYGSSFFYNGVVPLEYGPLPFGGGQLSGVLADGTPLDISFSRNFSGGTINLLEVPEPTSLVLLSLLGLASTTCRRRFLS